ncbi:MAG: hypothetical protein AAF266_04505 [Planctomycetota bacterium]
MTDKLRQIGLTPTKAALMAVLAIGLVVVWGPALSGLLGGKQATTPTVAVATPTPTRPRVAPATGSATRKPGTPAEGITKRKRPRPTITVAEAAAYDPFAPPAWSPSSTQVAAIEREAVEPSELESRFGTLRKSGVAMILVSSDGQAAQVGDRTLRVGDTIDGFQVVEINADGVTFEPAPPDEEGDARGA